MRKLNNISGTEIRGEDIEYLQRKISLAGEMKTSIKRFLDWWDHYDPNDETKDGVKRVKELRKAMENYLNCESTR